ncbi:MAG: hypothetical protein CVT47_01635 [Thermoplasmata archaeon HGW-Thermoplasmata-2]|nr:MAG: hypothetical protein CVT47_01635 [Thermoplasmata archaeon HGW-Thermoplasmata-2]
MWLITTALAAAIATAIWYAKDDGRYKMSVLCMMLWGATVMIFVDHVMGFLAEGGEFIEMTADAALLGIVLIIAALAIWEFLLLYKDPLNRFARCRTTKQ